MYTNANFLRDMAILGGSLLMAGISALMWGNSPTRHGSEALYE